MGVRRIDKRADHRKPRYRRGSRRVVLSRECLPTAESEARQRRRAVRMPPSPKDLCAAEDVPRVCRRAVGMRVDWVPAQHVLATRAVADDWRQGQRSPVSRGVRPFPSGRMLAVQAN